MAAKACSLLVDTTRCQGCRSCERACHDVNAPESARTGGSAQPRLKVVTHLAEGKLVHSRRACLHCIDPACVSVCPVRALEKLPHGPVVYHANRCMGCRYCMMACPFGVPTYTWDRARPVVHKCILCQPRLAKGLGPACAAACPTGATTFGDRSELLHLATMRIRSHPDRYLPTVYGEAEAGGTSVLVLAGVPFAAIGFPDWVRKRPYPELTWTALAKIPFLVAIEAGLLGGLYWIVRRREELRGAPASAPLAVPERTRRKAP